MSGLAAAAERLKGELDAVIAKERELAATLGTQEGALLRGQVDDILRNSAALDAIYGELCRVSQACRASLADLAPAGEGAGELRLGAVLRTLPAGLAAPLAERRTLLVAARRERARRAERNALIARVSLDAAASTRGIIARSVGGAAPLSRLDASV